MPQGRRRNEVRKALPRVGQQGKRQVRRHTYREAGVDRDVAAQAKERIARHARTTFTPEVVGDIGFFGSSFNLRGYRDPVLVSHCDGVGTKLKIAALMGRYDTVGQDLVHHCVNDIFTCGATPLFFLDYMAMGSLEPDKAEALIQGMAAACRALECALIGGETAEMPGVYHGDDFDLVGFIVGAVERDRVIDGSRIQPGDVILGLPSSGLHTNGYSLVRRVFKIDENPAILKERFPTIGRTLGEELLAPHRCYQPVLAPALRHIKGMAHITGGGLVENVPRVLPKRFAARFAAKSWSTPPIFRLIQERGGIEDREMYRVFNMGIGMVAVVAKDEVAVVQALVPEALVVGEVALQRGEQRVIIDRVGT
ncbi:MAG: phosphoribosylformylglycinamidine cyclo-ligase [Chloroflexi bacterium]|nr:phosphoribosylformylglycinamidine cyclo-ligase [Chloroflexota bacterium]